MRDELPSGRTLRSQPPHCFLQMSALIRRGVMARGSHLRGRGGQACLRFKGCFPTLSEASDPSRPGGTLSEVVERVATPDVLAEGT